MSDAVSNRGSDNGAMEEVAVGEPVVEAGEVDPTCPTGAGWRSRPSDSYVSFYRPAS